MSNKTDSDKKSRRLDSNLLNAAIGDVQRSSRFISTMNAISGSQSLSPDVDIQLCQHLDDQFNKLFG